MRNHHKLDFASVHTRVLFWCLLLFAAPAGMNAQTVLSSGLPVAFSFPASGSSVLLNGSLGYSIDVPANAILMVRLEMATANAEVDLYARFGSDVATQNGQITADASSRKPNGTQLLFLSNPLGPQAGTCRIALSLQTTGVAPAGRVIATLIPARAGITVTVPGISSITLAGQPDGFKDTVYGSAPVNSPVQVKVPLTPGKGIQFLAVGSISRPTTPFIPPEGLAALDSAGGSYGLTTVTARQSSLVGVFVGDSVSTENLFDHGLDFTGGLTDVTLIPPVLQEVFYVGNGLTPSGQPRTFVVPTGATRLFLASLDRAVSDNSGAWTATAIGDLPVPSPALSNPVTIPAISSITLAGQPYGAIDTVYGSVPLNAAVQVKVPLVPGQGIQVRATGNMSRPGTAVIPPEGLSGIDTSGGGYGLASVTAPQSSLVGVFVGDTINTANLFAKGLDFSGGLKDVATIPPTLQEVFYVGNGLTASGAVRTFTVPPGATRLFLATLDRAVTDKSGSWTASVSVAGANSPQISNGGVVNGAGFGASPLAAGSIASVFGSNFGSLTSATSVPLPTLLGGTQVFFNTIPAPLFFVSPGQINAQIPVELRGESSVLVTVAQNGQTGPAALLNLTGIAPGVFTSSPTSPVVVNFRTGRLVSDAEPAVRGDTLIIYASGIGPVLYDAATGSPSSSSVLSPALLPVQVTFSQGGASSTATPGFAGLAPGFIGVAQINVQIPADSPQGAVSLRVTSGSAVSGPVTISVQ
jgi:uncharacterized protein (TIGR03437 family)